MHGCLRFRVQVVGFSRDRTDTHYKLANGRMVSKLGSLCFQITSLSLGRCLTHGDISFRTSGHFGVATRRILFFALQNGKDVLAVMHPVSVSVLPAPRSTLPITTSLLGASR